LAKDRLDGKHFAIARRMVERGGRQDIFLGTRDCQGYVEPCDYGEGQSELDNDGELGFGMMLHGFDYPDETGVSELHARFWRPTMVNGRIAFPRPEACPQRSFVRPMQAKSFSLDEQIRSVEDEALALEVST
jgi:CRISPR-associated protein Cas5d